MSAGASDWRIPLTEPDLGDEEVAAVEAVIRSRWLTMGPVTAQFEQAFAARIGVAHAIAVGNCTEALHLANVALGIGPGDEVICPALTFVASASASRAAGAEVRIADSISGDDLTISPDDVAGLVTPRTRAIVVVHYAGFACRMGKLLALAERHGLAIIEDCAHGPVAWYRTDDGTRRPIGTIGRVGCFSFYGNKNLTTGEGGMLVTDDDDLAARIRLLRSHGMTSGTFERHTRHASGYDVVAIGFNYRPSEIQSAIGLCQLAKLERLDAQRRQVFAWYRDALATRDVLQVAFQSRNLDDSSCHILPAVATDEAGPIRDRLHAAGIQTSQHYTPLTRLAAYRAAARKLPVVDGLSLLTLPLAPAMTRDQVEWIAAVANGESTG